MNATRWLTATLLLLLIAGGVGFAQQRKKEDDSMAKGKQGERELMLSEEQLAKLSPEQKYVCVMGGTEKPFTGEFWDTKTPGTYVCAACGNELFTSKTKYASGSGWPSFYDVLNSDAVEKKPDHSYGMIRTEVVCGNCNAHLGHLFDDGPKPTGERYCINSAALELVPAEGGESAGQAQK